MELPNTLIIYELKEYFNSIITSATGQISPFSICFVFISGCLTAFNPCTISSLPFTLNYLNTNNTYDRLVNSWYVPKIISGLITSIFLFSIVTIFFSHQVFTFNRTFTLLIPILMIGLGLYTLDHLHNIMPTLVLHDRLRIILQQDYWVGFSLGLITISCNTPIIISTTVYITIANNWIIGVLLLCIYGFGYLIPFLFFILLINHIDTISNIVKRLDYINYILGCTILGSGIFSLAQHL